MCIRSTSSKEYAQERCAASWLPSVTIAAEHEARAGNSGGSNGSNGRSNAIRNGRQRHRHRHRHRHRSTHTHIYLFTQLCKAVRSHTNGVALCSAPSAASPHVLFARADFHEMDQNNKPRLTAYIIVPITHTMTKWSCFSMLAKTLPTFRIQPELNLLCRVLLHHNALFQYSMFLSWRAAANLSSAGKCARHDVHIGNDTMIL